MSRVGRHVRDARRARGLSPQTLATLVGYQNTNKGARRVVDFEATGHAHPVLIDKVAAALAIDPRGIERLAAMDRRDADAAFEAWLDAPAEPELFLLPLLAVRWRVPLPDDVKGDRDRAAEYTLALARERGSRACLVWGNRRWSYWVWYRRDDAHVQTDELVGDWVETTDTVNVPYARFGGRSVTLTFE